MLAKLEATKGLRRPEISNFGRFRSTRGVVSTPLPAENGYSGVKIMGRDLMVHGLVCRAFLGPPPPPPVSTDMEGEGEGEDYTADHIDRDPTNNHVSNLRWATKREQILNRDPDSESGGPRRSKPVKGRRKVVEGEEDDGDRSWTRHASSSEAGGGRDGRMYLWDR